jgi:hypothetical protein
MKTILILFSLLSLVRCTDEAVSTTNPQSETVILRSGTSFGMCIGYCVKDLEINGIQATFTKRANPIQQDRYPTRTCTQTITASKAADLKALALFNEFKKQPETIGCPDCADGGAEYVEMQVGDQKHRVKFEYNKTIPGFETLIKELRTQRETFNNCE